MESDGLFANRYRPLRLIGKGGMAAVYDVTDETTGERFALKRLHAEHKNRRTAEILFRREYNTLSELSHPLIIRAFDYGLDGDTPYYTMEILSGENLRTLAPLPWREAASLLRDVASALALVHSRRLIHRDVSPRNVCRTDDGRAKLIDFGTLSPMGPTRDVMGTPSYLSPESLEERPLDARSDLFSLGAVAYYLLTGEHAYPARRIAELGATWERPVHPPSTRAPEVPASLDALVLSLINLNPLARPGSAAEIFDRLTAIADLPKAEAPETARAYFLTPTLVARDDAMERFRRHLGRAERGRGGALIIEAARGYGRSRLLASFLLEAKLRGMVALRADADDRRREPFGVIRTLARSLAVNEPSLARDTFGADAAGGVSTRELVDFFIGVSQKRSLVIGVDDFEATDGPSAAVLANLAERATEWPLLVLATSPSGNRTPHVDRMRQAGGSIALAPFHAADTKALLSSVFGDTPHVEQTAAWAHRLSEGSPRTALELAQHLVDSGHARYHEGGWVLPASLDGLNLPVSIDQALDDRVAALPRNARALAEALAMTSEDDPLLVSEFPSLTEDRDLGALFGALNDLVSASVLVPSDSTYAFVSSEVKDAVRRAIPEPRLRDIHRRLAHAYESGPDRVATLAAHHMLYAGNPAEAFRIAVSAVEELTDYFARGNSFLRTPAGAETIERLFLWGRDHRMPAKSLSLIARGVLQLAAVGDARLARYGPAILEGLKRDAGLLHWDEFAHLADPVERVRACIGEAYARYASSAGRDERLEPGTAIQELGTAAATLTGVYARRLDIESMTALDELMGPLRPLSLALDVVGGVVHYAVGALRGRPTRDERLRVQEQTREPVPGIDELSRVGIHLLGLYYMALESTLQGYAWADELVAPLEGHAAYAPLAWQARMLSHYYRGAESEAQRCRRRRDLAMTGRLDIDGHLETSVLYEASVYATLGDLMALKALVPSLEERSQSRPGWRPFTRLASGNCHFLRGEYAKAVAEYELGLANESGPSATGTVLISIRLVRSLVALGRAEDARALAEATLQSRGDLMPLYVDQLELGLAAAEAALGRTDEAFARAGRIVERAEARGLSGVLLVDLLAETALIARAAGEDAVFDALTRRVGDLSATVDSIAFAARYSQLVRVGRASVIDGLANGRSSVPPESIQTSLGVDVRTKLELCRGPNERATRALALLLEHSASSEGFLYLHRQGRLALAAAIPNVEPAEELDRSVREWLRMTLDTEAATQTASRSQPLTIEPGSSFEIFGIVTAMDGIARMAGVAALRCRYGKLTPVPSAIMSALGEGLVRAGDATPLTTFSGTADPAMPRL